MYRILICGFAVFLLFGCSSNPSNETDIESPKKRAQWINPLIFNTDLDNQLSFPIWFDDSLIRVHQIAKITRRIYGSFETEDVDSALIRKTFPREKREFYFDVNGFVDRIVIYSYYDDREIARSSYFYTGNMDNNGFRLAQKISSKQIVSKYEEVVFLGDEIQQANPISTCYLLGKTKKFFAYQNQDRKETIFSLRESKFWNPLSVDSILKPQPSDWIVFGNLKKPHKRYRVKNTVLESDVHKYTYFNTGILKAISINKDAFNIKRDFQYANSGAWIAYTDSTFAEQYFIHRTVSTFNFDSLQRPIEIRHSRQKNNKEKLIYLESFRFHNVADFKTQRNTKSIN
jgi:hypothetical protein